MNLLNRNVGRAFGLFSLILAASSPGQNQPLPSLSYDRQTNAAHLDWNSNSNRTFFPQASSDLHFWDYVGAIHFGPGQHGGVITSPPDRAFFRLAYSDLPVASESEAETADFDLDGLTNIRELQEENTDPLNADSDGDGLPDGWEVAHLSSPLDDGSIDPQNGPTGVFRAAATGEIINSGSFAPLSVPTNLDAYASGVRAHASATLVDRDGDGIIDGRDAAPLSRCIDWETDNSWPRFVYAQLPNYNSAAHGQISGCNGRGDVIAGKAALLDGTWQPLAQLPTGSSNYLPIKAQVGPRQHQAYALQQPIASGISNDGKIIGTATVYFETIVEEVSPNEYIWHTPPSTQLTVIWDQYSAAPRIFAHAPNSILSGSTWDESPQIADDGTIVIKRRADPVVGDAKYLMTRYAPGGGATQTATYPAIYPTTIGPDGFQEFDIGSANAFAWMPGEVTPKSLLAEATFATANPSSSFSNGPTFIGMRPGAPDGYGLTFWGKTMLRHEGRWQEAVELGSSALLSSQGLAFQGSPYFSYQVWKGGRTRSLVSSVVNSNLTSPYTSLARSTSDGRVLIEHLDSGYQVRDGFLLPVDVVSLDRYVEVSIPEGAIKTLGGADQFSIRLKSATSAEVHGLVNNTLSGAYIHDSEGQMLDDNEIATYGSTLDQRCYNDLHQDSAIWKDGNRLKIATTFNQAGPIQIEFVSAGTVVATIDYTLTPLSDFSSLINTLDDTLAEIPFGTVPPVLSLNSNQQQYGTLGFFGDLVRRNLVTKCMQAVYTTVKQHVIEGVAKVSPEAAQALKIAAIGGEGFVIGLWAGVKDDWQGLVDGVQLLGSLLTNPIETGASFLRGFKQLCGLSMAQLSQIPQHLINQFLEQATQNIAWAQPSSFDLAVYTIAYTTGFITEKVGLAILTGGVANAAQGFFQGMNLAGKFAGIISKIQRGERLLKKISIVTTNLHEKVQALGAMKAKAFRAMSQYVGDRTGLTALREFLDIRFRSCSI